MNNLKIVGLVVVGILLLIGLSIGVPYCTQGVNRLTLEPRTDIMVMNPRNYIQNYDYFFDTYNEIKGKLPLITIYYDSWQSSESGQEKMMSKTNYDGMVAYILSIIAEYNSKSSSHFHERFKDVKLPYRLSLSVNGRDYIFVDGQF
jgi:hypothetical protein